MRARAAAARLGRRWAHLLIGGALFMPYFLLGTVLVQVAVPGSDPWRHAGVQLGILAAGLPLVAVTALLTPARPLGTAAARALCDVPPEALEDGPARSWPARSRTAVWTVAHTGLGSVIGGASLAVPPAVLVLLATPLSGALRDSRWGHLPTALAPLAGLGLLAGLIAAAWGAGALLARLAPSLLGPAPADRLAAAERRAAELAARNRLARELHDSVGHALSAATLQAAAARRVLESDPAFVREALAAIEETTRQAVAELDTVLGLLREGEPASAAPAPTLADLPRLLARTRAAGLEIAFREPIEGMGRVPATVSREAYRIIQEGLANALRHSGGQPVRLTLTTGPEELAITVDNPLTAPARPGTAAAPRPGGGRGLPGIAERATLLGGTARWGPADGRWRLAVRLPLGPFPEAAPARGPQP